MKKRPAQRAGLFTFTLPSGKINFAAQVALPNIMNHDKRVHIFGYELRRSLIEHMVMELTETSAKDAAMYYFDNDREFLAKQLAEKLMDSTIDCELFFERFKLLPWRKARIVEKLVLDALYLPGPHAPDNE